MGGRSGARGTSAQDPAPAQPVFSSKALQTVLIHPFNTQQPQECAICLACFASGTEAAKLPCGRNHIFHHDCLMEWLVRNPSCPLCRQAPPGPSLETQVEDILRSDHHLQQELAQIDLEMQREIANLRRSGVAGTRGVQPLQADPRRISATTLHSEPSHVDHGGLLTNLE